MVFENRSLRNTLKPKKDEVPGEGQTLHKGESYDPHCSPNVFWGMKSRIMRWVAYVRGAFKF